MALNTKNISNSSDFSSGKVSKVLLKFAIPAIISLFVAELYNMVDTIFVGRAIGATAIGALTIAFPIQRLIISIGLLIAVGASTFVARSLGEKNHEKVGQIITNALSIMIVGISIIIMLIYVFKSFILTHLGATDTIFSYADQYVSIVILGGLFQCSTVIVGYIMIALGNAKANLVATSIGAVCNIIINYILVIVLSFGVSGAAIATVVSQAISAIYMFHYLLKLNKKLNLSFSFTFNKSIILSILCVGFSTFIVEISDAVVAIILNNLLVAEGGDTAIIIVGIITKVSMFMYITIIGITSAMQPMVAFNYGAKNYKRLKEIVKESTIAVSITSIIIWIVMLVLAPQVIGSFVKEKDILNEAVIAFRIVISIFPCIAPYFVAIYYYQAIEEARLSFVLSIYRQLLIFIPILLILVKFSGVMGAWIAHPASDLISAITGVFYMKKAMASLNDRYVEFQSKKAVKPAYRKLLNEAR